MKVLPNALTVERILACSVLNGHCVLPIRHIKTYFITLLALLSLYNIPPIRAVHFG